MKFFLFLPCLISLIAIYPGVGRAQVPSPAASLAQAVYLAIAHDDSLKGYTLNVDVQDGIVTLRGKVNDETLIPRLIRRAAAVAGVRKVISEIVKRPPPTDAEMEEAARTALKRAGFINAPHSRTRLRVTVEDGVAYLRGQAELPRQIDSALSALISVYGVRDVRNFAVLPQYPAPNFPIEIPR